MEQLTEHLAVQLAQAVCGDDHFTCSWPDCKCKETKQKINAVHRVVGTEIGKMNWQPHFDYNNEAKWPPKEHPLYSMFHDARLQFENGEWNYKKALEYAAMAVSVPDVKESQ